MTTLPGCVSLLPDVPPVPKLVELEYVSNVSDYTGKAKQALLIDQPVAPKLYSSSKIRLLQKDDSGVEFFSFIQNAEWSTRLPLHLQSVLIQALQSAGTWKAVASADAGMQGSALLKPEIRDFYASDIRGAHVVVRLQMYYLSHPQGDIIASKDFSYRQDIPSLTLANILTGFRQATQQALQDISSWAAGAS
ncbi:MAG: ABC-type transport auxiliary lipoprotein family protein [Alphaproteobacteria bacterium]